MRLAFILCIDSRYSDCILSCCFFISYPVLRVNLFGRSSAATVIVVVLLLVFLVSYCSPYILVQFSTGTLD